MSETKIMQENHFKTIGPRLVVDYPSLAMRTNTASSLRLSCLYNQGHNSSIVEVTIPHGAGRWNGKDVSKLAELSRSDFTMTS